MELEDDFPFEMAPFFNRDMLVFAGCASFFLPARPTEEAVGQMMWQNESIVSWPSCWITADWRKPRWWKNYPKRGGTKTAKICSVYLTLSVSGRWCFKDSCNIHNPIISWNLKLTQTRLDKCFQATCLWACYVWVCAGNACVPKCALYTASILANVC